MITDEQLLIQLNIDIGRYENEGKREDLRSIIAPKLAFMRADGKTIDDRCEFLDKVKELGENQLPRETVEVKPILYKNRAVVVCIVKVGKKFYHNLRLFTKQDGQWRLLGWANEEWPYENVTNL